MSNHLHLFQTGNKRTLVSLPFELNEMITEWNKFRSTMIREMPSEFTRDEWAYLIQFISEESLRLPFEEYFGELVQSGNKEFTKLDRLLRPKGTVGLWLPNNVSLLGPLMLILLSLSGSPVRIKIGSNSENLTGVFVQYILDRTKGGALHDYLEQQVSLQSFDRTDPRNAELAASAQVRILFGSDEAAHQVEQLEHPVESSKTYFVDRISQGWVEASTLTDELVDTIIKVFAVYGLAGCTSPSRIVMINGDESQAKELMGRIVQRWPSLIREVPPPNVASSGLLGLQHAKALGWDAEAVQYQHAVIANGAHNLEIPASNMFLPITWATLDEATEWLPSNIQTIGHSLTTETYGKLVEWMASSPECGVSRLVPLPRMHHFHYVWDGFAFWRDLFTEIELGER